MALADGTLKKEETGPMTMPGAGFEQHPVSNPSEAQILPVR
jgi:hypothetical protein